MPGFQFQIFFAGTDSHSFLCCQNIGRLASARRRGNVGRHVRGRCRQVVDSTSAGIHRSLCILYMHVLSLRAVPAHRSLHLNSLSSTRSSGQVRGSGCCKKSMMHRGRNQAMTSWHVSATFLSTFPRRALARPAISWQKGKMTGVARTKGRPELRRRRRAKRQARRHVRRPGVQLAILRTRLNAASGGAQEHA